MNPVRHYFQLQFTLLNRHIKAFGLPPWLGYLLSLLLFAGFSLFLFYRTEYAPYLLALGGGSLLINLSGHNRNDFLKSCYKTRLYRIIRLLENSLAIFPFLIVLWIKNSHWIAAATAVGAVLLVFVQMRWDNRFTLPTPFYRWPFEFAVGFRKTVLFLLLAYFLVVMAVAVGNFNLGVFALILVFLICLGFYADMETNYYVWVHSQQPSGFLWHKIKIALRYASLLTLPIAATLCLFQPANWHLVLVFQLMGYAYLSTFVLAKYSAFPQNMGIPQSILLAMSFTMPPLLVVAAWYFYRQSTRKLQPFLP